MARPTYLFGNGTSEGNAGMKSLLGIRGAHACEMANLGLPVSPGFCITSRCLRQESGGHTSLTDTAKTSIKEAVGGLEDLVGRRFGSLVDPLVLSVQGDLLEGIPGFCGTIANIGLNDATVEAWANVVSPHFVWDSYRRLISTFSRAVRRLNMEPFERELSDVKTKLNGQCRLGRLHADCHIPTRELRNLVAKYKDFFEEQTGEPFPQEPEKQLWEAVYAASRSWDHGDWQELRGVTVQSTVFGNHDFRSAVGVAFPSTSSNEVYDEEDDDAFAPLIRGEWLTNAMFEDLDSSDRELLHLTEDASRDWAADRNISDVQREQEYLSLEEDFPSVFAQLLRCQDIVENHIADVKGFDFAIGQGRLWILQTRTSAWQRDMLVRQPEVVLEADELVPQQGAIAMDATLPSEVEVITSEAAKLEVKSAADVIDDTQTQLDSQSAFSDTQLQIEEDSADSCADIGAMEEVCEESVHVQSCVNDIQLQSCLPNGSSRYGLSMKRGLLGTRLWRWRRASARHTATGNAKILQTDDMGPVQPRSKSGESMFVLPVWQTGLAGGTAAVACRAVATGLQDVKPATFMQKHWCQGFRNLLAAGVMSSAARAFQTGAVCCTLYTNLCTMTPADDSRNKFSPVWRLGCAGFAATAANAVTHAAGTLQTARFLQKGPAVLPPTPAVLHGMSPMLAAVVPTMAMEMCTIDLVRNAAVERGYEVTPGLLFASGAAAGVATQLMLQPLQVLKSYKSVPLLLGTCSTAGATLICLPPRESVSRICTNIGSACLRSSPVVAVNSLVRVGLVTYFMASR